MTVTISYWGLSSILFILLASFSFFIKGSRINHQNELSETPSKIEKEKLYSEMTTSQKTHSTFSKNLSFSIIMGNWAIITSKTDDSVKNELIVSCLFAVLYLFFTFIRSYLNMKHFENIYSYKKELTENSMDYSASMWGHLSELMTKIQNIPIFLSGIIFSYVLVKLLFKIQN